DPDTKPPLRELALASARVYPEFVAEVEAESGMKIDFRRDGTIYLAGADVSECSGKKFTEAELETLEPAFECAGANAFLLQEDSVDPRDVMAAAIAVARKRGVEIAKGSPVTEITVQANRVIGVKT